MQAPVGGCERTTGLGGERLQDQLLGNRGTLPTQLEVGVLGAQDRRDGRIQARGGRAGVERGLLPEEVGELLRGVRMPGRSCEQVLTTTSSTALARTGEALADEAGELLRLDRAELERLALRQNGSFSSLKIRSIM